MRRWLGRSVLAVLACVALSSCTETPISSLTQKIPTPQASVVAPPAIVISQVFGGGGNLNAVYKSDFVELFNPGTTSVSVSGWSVQYASSTGTTWGVTALTGSIPAGGYYLVKQADGANTLATPLPTPDATGSAAMSGTNAKVALVASTTALIGACPASGYVDLFSYGSTSCSPNTTAALSNTTAALRKTSGCTYSGNPLNDFDIAAPAPRNSATAAHPCFAVGPVAKVVLTPGSANLVQDGTQQFTASAFDASNNAVTTATFTWQLTDSSKASVTSAGLLTATAPGDLQIIAASNGFADTSDVHIDPPVVVSVVVTPASATIIQNATQQFTAKAYDSQNREVNSATFTWTSTPSTVASVSPTGLATGLQPGGATITARTPNGVEGTAALTVNTPPPPPPGIVISEIMANPNGTDTDGEWFELYNPTASAVSLQNWRVDSNGDVGITIGNLTIAAHGFVVLGVSATIPGVTVQQVYSPLSSAGLVLANGNTSGSAEFLQLKDPYGQVADRVNWNTYAAPSGVSRVLIDVTADNLDIAGANWENTSTDITYGTASNHGTPGSGDYDHGPLATLVLSPNPAYVSTIGAFQMRYTGRDANGVAVRTPLTWTSANPSVATVDATTGVVHGVSVGVVNITATAENGVSALGELRVLLPGVPATVSIAVNDPVQVPVGYTKPAFATVRDADFNQVTTSSPLIWTSDNTSIATVDQRGYIHGQGQGVTRIRATTTEGATGSISFTVLSATAPTSAIYRNHIEFGMPNDGDPSNDSIITRPQYVLSYSGVRGGPNWVSWNVNATHFGPAPRCDCFTADSASVLSPIEDADYRNSGYDRGHMVQSESRTTTDQENASTFLLTNILPQAGNNNQGPWSQFENYVNDLARTSGKELYVIAGGEYVANPTTLKNEGKVQIPDYTWKIVVIMSGGKGVADVHSMSDLQVLAIRMPNLLSTALNIRNTPWQSFTTTVDAIEAATGYDFLAGLPDKFEIAVESNTQPPVAAVNGPYNGVANGAAVSMSGAASSDADGDALTYAWSYGDGASGTGVTTAHTYTRSGDFTVRLIVTDIRGIADTASTVAHISDVTAAVITPTVTGTTGSNGWYTSDIQISWSVSDPESDVASSTGCDATAVTTDTNGVTYTCSATNGFGLNSSESVTVKRDASLPTVAYLGNAGTYTVADTVAITCSTADVGPSGLAGTTCTNVNGAAYTFALGSNTFSSTATDNAGNVGSGTTSFTVVVTTASLCKLQTSFTTKSGIATTICNQLSAVQTAINQADPNGKSGLVAGLINTIEAQRGKAYTSAEADALIRFARNL